MPCVRARGPDRHPPPADPDHLAALKRANFHITTLAGNHMFDQGAAGVEDTIATLHSQSIATTGAGMNLEEARRPAIIARGGVRFGVLSYNCVGPRDSWATHKKAGVAYVHVLTHYELNYATPGGPPRRHPQHGCFSRWVDGQPDEIAGSGTTRKRQSTKA